MCAEIIASHSMLHALPNEILTLIFDHLFDDQRQQAELDNDVREYDLPTTYLTLYALARTCRGLSQVAGDILRQKCVWEFRHPIGPFAQRAQTERYHGKYPDCRQIEVLSDARWDGRSFYDGLAEEELKAALATQEDWPENVWEILEKDPAQVQLALLVARSPNLREFIMGALHIEMAPDDLPIWLYPIIQGAHSNLVNVTHDPVYGNLQIVDIDMQNVITPLVGHLFALPLWASCKPCVRLVPHQHSWLQASSLETLQLDMLEDLPAMYMVFAQGPDQRVSGKRHDEGVN